MLAVLLALGTAVGYGIANYLAPVLGRRMALGAVLLGGQIAGLAVSMVLALGTDVTLGASGLAIALGAGVANAAALACLYQAGRIGNLSVVTPVAASGAVVPVLVGMASGDRLSAIQLVGMPFVLLGIVLAARRPAAPTAAGPGATAAKVASRGVGWALLAALLFGGFMTTYARAAADSSGGALLWSRVGLVATTGIALLTLRAPVRVRPRDGLLVLVPGLLLALATFAYGEASRIGLLSVVSVIATLAPVVTVLLAFVLLRERPTHTQWTGTAVALTGLVLLTLG